MKLILDDQRRKLIRQGSATSAAYAEGREPPEHRPVVKLFTPDAACTWLLSELDPEDPDIAFGAQSKSSYHQVPYKRGLMDL